MAAQMFDNETAINISWSFLSFTRNQCPQFFPILVRHHKTDNRVIEVHGKEVMLGLTEPFRTDKHREDEFMVGMHRIFLIVDRFEDYNKYSLEKKDTFENKKGVEDKEASRYTQKVFTHPKY
uniref:Protein yippee-like n=1 Tax=Caenorhabditis tropicalis TaxID=1561998 RepID=A0A1I7TL53_9PELO